MMFQNGTWSHVRNQVHVPEAHAVAYVMMGWRVAYYKIKYPLAYYTAFFSIRASAFDYQQMCLGKEALEENLAALQKKDKNDMSATEKDMVRDMDGWYRRW